MPNDLAKQNKKIVGIDLFCGVGGLTHGLKKTGVDIKLGIDIDPLCEYPFTQNNDAKFILKSVEDIKGVELKPYLDQQETYKLIVGCAPCQTFSTYNPNAKEQDDRWWLLSHFSRLIDEVQPDFISMENVPGLTKHAVFTNFLSNLSVNNYQYDYKIVNCDEYGIPQMRKRLVLIASKHGSISILTPNEFGKPRMTVKEAIGELPKIKAGESDPQDPLHQSANLTPVNMKRIHFSNQGGTWRDWPDEYISNCHKKDTGKTYPSVYGRMSWGEPAPTITTQFYGYGNGRFGHPEQDRALSLREGAILQSFPPDYKFFSPGTLPIKKNIGRMIGNAVPVTLGEMIGKSLNRHLETLS
jgi:DNA (cytosine-5)-methyltransferase 1